MIHLVSLRNSSCLRGAITTQLRRDAVRISAWSVFFYCRFQPEDGGDENLMRVMLDYGRSGMAVDVPDDRLVGPLAVREVSPLEDLPLRSPLPLSGRSEHRRYGNLRRDVTTPASSSATSR